MKKYLLLLAIPLVLLSGCDSVMPPPQPTPTYDATRIPSSYTYFHDTTHHVGIWWNAYSGAIAILPDGEYVNVGIQIGDR